jgi:hypothetical protein
MRIESEDAKGDRKAIMAAARAAMQAANPGVSPRARGVEKTRLVLNWVYRWGWASSSTIEIIGGVKRSGLAARLVKNGLLQSTKTESGGAVKGIPAHVLTLTKTGLNAALKELVEDDELLEYELDAYKIRQDQLRHYEFAQRSTALNLADDTIKDYRTESQTTKKSFSKVKQHDVIWITSDGTKIGIEIELSPKHSRKLDEFVLSCLLSVKPKSDGSATQVDEIFIVTDVPAIQRRYRQAFKVGERVMLWTKNKAGFVVADTDDDNKQKSFVVPAWSEGKISCHLFKD